MPAYSYRALNSRGRLKRGTINAANELDLQYQLQQAGMALVEAKLHGASLFKTPEFLLRLQPVSRRDLAQLCLHLEQLQRAGVKITDSLADVAASCGNKALEYTLYQVATAVEDGQSLSAAMGMHPRVFPSLMLSLVAAGETSGKLAEIFKQLTDYFNWQDTMRRRLLRAAAYPSFAFAAMLAVIVFTMAYVVPETRSFLTSLNIELPAHTLLLISLSSAVETGWVDFFSLIFLAAITIWLARKYVPELAYYADQALLHVPLAGNLIRKVNLARFAHTFAIMFNSGVELLPALETSGRTITNTALHEALTVMREQVQTGNSLSTATKLSGEFPLLVQRMILIGEESGKLGAALTHVANYYEADTQNAMQSLIGAVGPLLTLVAGGLLAWLATAVFVPIYDALPRLMQ